MGLAYDIAGAISDEEQSGNGGFLGIACNVARY